MKHRRPLAIVSDHRLAIRYISRTEFVPVSALLALQAQRNCTRIIADSGQHRVYAAFSETLSWLEPLGLLRIHRGAAVQQSRVSALIGRGGHRLVIVLDTGLELPVGRGFQRAIRDRLDPAWGVPGR